jgi:hypothetical protein
MKSKKFKHGNKTYKSYVKKVGAGYEVGLTCAGKSLFVGNFLKSSEANQWYTFVNQELPRFTKKYWITKTASHAFYQKFLSQDLYKKYYDFVNKLASKYNREAERSFKKHERRYKSLKKNWVPKEKVLLKRAA